jgi:RND family efflux transporter MFP subunit
MKKALVILSVVIALAGGIAIGLFVARVPGAAAPAAGDRAAGKRSSAVMYRCPMHPHIVSDEPGHCPICNMTLVAFTPSDAGTPVAPDAGAESSTVPGFAAVVLDDEQRRMVGARSVPVATVPVLRSIRTVGLVSVDETRMQHVHTKVQGWVEHVHVGATGEVVRRGEALLTIYSPELYASEQEFLVALDNQVRLAASPIADARGDAARLVDSARKRLNLLDVSDEQIDALAASREAQKSVTVYSSVSGTITARNVNHGERVETATSLLDIADLGTVWVTADVYESDLAFVHEGQEATITLSYLPGRAFKGRVQVLSPIVDATTRTVKARIVLDNADLALRPGMFADVVLTDDLGARLTVPKDAVMRTGTRDLVFVEEPGGRFAPRAIVLGIELPDRWEVTSGLSDGERILSAANFFVDAESKLQAALAQGGSPPPGHARHGEHGAHP